MVITFATASLRKLVNDKGKLVRRFGKECADLIRRRLDDMDAAENLAAMKKVHQRTHPMTGNLKGLISMDVKHPKRLLVRPLNGFVGAGANWERVTAVEVVDIRDTH